MNGNNALNTQEIFGVMGQLKDKFNSHISGNINQNELEETVESENFIGYFYQFSPSGGRLNPGENLVNEDGVATINQDIRFQIRISPKNGDNAPPLRLEVDNCHRIGTNRVIHINSSDGQIFNVPNTDVNALMPGNCIDLIRISGSEYFRNAIIESLRYWEI